MLLGDPFSVNAEMKCAHLFTFLVSLLSTFNCNCVPNTKVKNDF